MNKTDVTTLDLLVRKSLEQYHEIYDMLKLVGPNLDSQLSNHIKKINEALGGMQKLAQETDRELTDLLRAIGISETVAEPLARRTKLQEKILVLLKETAVKANIVKSLLASEMQSLKKGRKAMDGYKTISDYQGRIIAKTS
jgi:hypothetical protein